MNFLPLSLAVPNQLSYLIEIAQLIETQPRSQRFPAAIPYSGIILYYILLPDIAIYAFQIWSMLTGYEKLARGFEGIRNREIL